MSNGSVDVLQGSELVEDEISRCINKSWDELFGMERAEIDAFQLAALKQRFEQLVPQVRALKTQADNAGITCIDAIEDAVPLLFQHSTYKSYPMSILEKGRFDMLTRWLDGLTSLDLSGADVSQCTGIDNWLDTLEAQTALRPNHTSGTTGKLSFIPRSTLEQGIYNKAHLKQYEGFGDNPGVKFGGEDGVRMPVIYPGQRYGRYLAQMFVQHMEKHVAPTPDQVYCAFNGTLSADLASLSGRIRVAQAKGELGSMQMDDNMRATLKRYLEEMERRPQETADFFGRMANELSGQRVLLISQTSYLFQATEKAEAMGITNAFSPDSIGLYGGGAKGVVLPDDWFERVKSFTGINNWKSSYAMTEITGNMPMCEHGHYHIHPLHIPMLLDPNTGECLPRAGRQTGRFASIDLLAQTYWGGFVTGDEVTLDWENRCACGRKGVYALNKIERYSEKVTGDDKVNCAATIDNTDSSLKALLETACV